MTGTFQRFTIGTRMALCFAMLLSLLLVLAFLAYDRIKTIQDTIAFQNHLQQEVLAPLYTTREALAQTGIAARNAFIYKNEQDAQRELTTLEQQKALYLAALARVEPFLADDRGFATVRTGLLQMAKELERPARYRAAGAMDDYGRFLVEECSPLRRQIVADMEVVIRDVEGRMKAATDASSAVVSRSLLLIAVLTLVALVTSVVLALLATRSIVRPIRQAVDVARRVAAGDLTSEIASDRHDEIGDVLEALQQMQTALATIVHRVRSGADAIATAAVQVNTGNRDLSSRTERTAGALQETAASTEQLNATVKQNADNAHVAKELSLKASDVAARGGRLFTDVVATMAQIGDDSTQIGDIVGVIDGIAFQTNILALNAAVEAARAGEQGRGFAVVASEVRALAQRSSAAAKEIKELIGASGAKVTRGSELVNAAGQTMSELVAQVQQVRDVVSQISLASDEQATGVELINRAVTDVDQLTQQNATLVEDAAAAAQTLQQEADALTRQVKVFTTR